MRYFLKQIALVFATSIAITGFVWAFGAFVAWDVNWFNPMALRYVAMSSFLVSVFVFLHDS